MKQLALCIIVFLFFSRAGAQKDTLTFSVNEIDFGNVKGFSTRKDSVWLYNKEKKPLTIKRITWGADYCPCLYGKNMTVAPGDSFLIVIHCVRVSEAGPFSRSMSVDTNLGLFHVKYKGEFLEEKPVAPPPADDKKKK